MTILKSNDLGIDVALLQIRLGLRPTFYFDDRTTKAVQAFQKAHKLKPDGEVGPLTRKVLDLKPADKTIAINPLKPWLPIARSQIGIKKNAGWWLWADNRRIVEYHQTTEGKATAAEVPWCAAFVNWVITRSGRVGQNSAAAKDWLKFDDKVTAPEPGDIVIVRTAAAEKAEEQDKQDRRKSRDGYHVGFYVSGDNSHVRILGGNQSDQVKESNYPLTGKDAYVVKGYRRPKDAGTTAYLKLGNIEGSVTAKGHEGWLQIATLSFGTERNVSMETGNLSNRESSRPTLSHIALTRMADKSMPALLQASLKGSAGMDATIAFVHTGKTMQEFITYKLRNVIVSGYALNAPADQPPVEGVTLSYSAIEATCTEHDASGKACSPQRVAYDVQAAKVA